MDSSRAKGWLVRHFGRKFIVHKRSHQSQSHQRSNAVCKSRTLDSTSRLGGINLVHLPASVARTPLCVPTSVAATAEYLMNHGKYSPFRPRHCWDPSTCLLTSHRPHDTRHISCARTVKDCRHPPQTFGYQDSAGGTRLQPGGIDHPNCFPAGRCGLYGT